MAFDEGLGVRMVWGGGEGLSVRMCVGHSLEEAGDGLRRGT